MRNNGYGNTYGQFQNSAFDANILSDYIVDFVCLKLNLIIEVDGAYHNEPLQQEEDAIRSEYLREMGFIILRFTNEEVLYDTDSVIQTINKQIQQRKLLFYETY